MAYDHQRLEDIKNKSVIDLVEFMIIRAITVSKEEPEAIWPDVILDNEFIWAKEELERKLNCDTRSASTSAGNKDSSSSETSSGSSEGSS